MISTIYKLFKMTRPVNIVIAIITLLVGYTLLQHNPTLPVLILQMLGFATAIGFANIQNDILDLECDKLSHPERPLATGEVSVKAARITCYTLAAITLLCGIGDSVIQNIRFIDIVKDPEHALDFGWMGALILSFPMWFFALLCALLVAYNRTLKRSPALKNITVAFLCTTPLLYAVQHFFNFSNHDFPEEHMWAIIPAIPFAFLLTIAREIYKDLEDKTGDLKAGIMTFPLVVGDKVARRLAGDIIIFTWISLPLPVFFLDKLFDHNYPPIFLAMTAATLTPCFFIVIMSASSQNYRRAQTFTKFAMLLGLISLLFCSIVQ
ncbi:UbiA family prenyltransferase [Fibrobacter sp. UWB13]|jgi:4-hydroxybenzoate polyprenyltransferase|uniref:UbiA family prenyltransferase n=1 Tax=Fibrobacter sp. UWB13 TaxID=1896204 RepID=UPI000A0B44F8|nr:UbiA family prenyltransferase [Fibrobacter sp. UWB13]SMG08989.1 4-hydroxybenzoate polyprenyltransferase [Fibrobacter sp. UWB13]